MTPEKAFLVRAFVEHCKEEKENDRLEAALPVVTQIAFYIQESFNALQDLGSTGMDVEEEHQEREEGLELTLGELLRVAAHLDYSDEIGRRKMDTLTCRFCKIALLQSLMP